MLPDGLLVALEGRQCDPARGVVMQPPLEVITKKQTRRWDTPATLHPNEQLREMTLRLALCAVRVPLLPLPARRRIPTKVEDNGPGLATLADVPSHASLHRYDAGAHHSLNGRRLFEVVEQCAPAFDPL